MKTVQVYTLLGQGGVQGARLDMSYAAVLTLLEFLDTEERIKGVELLSVPCLIRGQLQAIKETHDRIQRGEIQPAEREAMQ